MAGTEVRPKIQAVLTLSLGVLIGASLQRCVSPTSVPLSARELARASSGDATSKVDAPANRIEAHRSAYDRLVQLSFGRGDWVSCLPLIAQLSPEECRKALGLFSKWGQEDREVAQELILRRWASADPADALRAMDNLPSRFHESIVKDVAREFVARDPKQALELISGPGLSRPKVLLANAIMNELATVNPEAAAQFLSQHGLPIDRDIYGSIASGLARGDVQAALEWAGSLKGTEREAAVRAAWQTWASKDPAGAALALSQGDKESRPKGEEVYSAIAGAWSQLDPSSAAAWIQGLPSNLRTRAWKSFSPDVQQLGASGCSKLLDSIGTGQQQTELAGRMAMQMANRDARQAVDWAESLSQDDLRATALGSAVSSWAQKDPASALAWAQSLPVGADRDEAASRSARNLAYADPVQAAKWVNLIQNPSDRMLATSAVARDWAALDSEAAAAWVRQLPDADSLTGAHSLIAQSWAFANPGATEKWIGTLPSGAARDSAIIGFVQTMDGYDPGLATRWAASLDEPSQRAEYVIGTFRRWMNEGDSGAARQWLQTANLDADVRSKLVRYIAASPGNAE